MEKKAKKPKKAPQKIDKELELRVKEEQERLRQKKESPKAQKKQKDISDKVETKVKKPKEDSIQKQLDYHKFLEAQMQKLEYSAMFSYLGNSVKVNTYEYGAEDERVKIAYKKDETLEWEKVKQFTDEKKMDWIMGLDRNFETSSDREAYKWWKAFNKGWGEYLFQISMT